MSDIVELFIIFCIIPLILLIILIAIPFQMIIDVFKIIFKVKPDKEEKIIKITIYPFGAPFNHHLFQEVEFPPTVVKNGEELIFDLQKGTFKVRKVKP
jgi:hypothetical protein